MYSRSVLVQEFNVGFSILGHENVSGWRSKRLVQTRSKADWFLFFFHKVCYVLSIFFQRFHAQRNDYLKETQKLLLPIVLTVYYVSILLMTLPQVTQLLDRMENGSIPGNNLQNTNANKKVVCIYMPSETVEYGDATVGREWAMKWTKYTLNAFAVRLPLRRNVVLRALEENMSFRQLPSSYQTLSQMCNCPFQHHQSSDFQAHHQY